MEEYEDRCIRPFDTVVNFNEDFCTGSSISADHSTASLESSCKHSLKCNASTPSFPNQTIAKCESFRNSVPDSSFQSSTATLFKFASVAAKPEANNSRQISKWPTQKSGSERSSSVSNVHVAPSAPSSILTSVLTHSFSDLENLGGEKSVRATAGSHHLNHPIERSIDFGVSSQSFISHVDHCHGSDGDPARDNFSDLSATTNTISILKAKIADLYADLESVKSAYLQSAEHEADLKEMVSSLRRSRDWYEEQLSLAQSVRTQMETETERVHTLLRDATGNSHKLIHENACLRSQLACSRASLAAANRNLSQQLEAIRVDMIEREALFERIACERAELEEVTLHRSDELNSLQAEVSSLKMELNDAHAHATQKHTRFIELEKSLSEAESRCSSLEEQLRSFESKYQLQANQLEDYVAKCLEAGNRIKFLECQIADKDSAATVLVEEKRSLTDALLAAREEKDILDTYLTSMKEKVSLFEEKFEKVRLELNAKNMQIIALTEHCDHLSTQVTAQATHQRQLDIGMQNTLLTQPNHSTTTSLSAAGLQPYCFSEPQAFPSEVTGHPVQNVIADFNPHMNFASSDSFLPVRADAQTQVSCMCENSTRDVSVGTDECASKLYNVQSRDEPNILSPKDTTMEALSCYVQTGFSPHLECSVSSESSHGRSIMTTGASGQPSLVDKVFGLWNPLSSSNVLTAPTKDSSSMLIHPVTPVKSVPPKSVKSPLSLPEYFGASSEPFLGYPSPDPFSEIISSGNSTQICDPTPTEFDVSTNDTGYNSASHVYPGARPGENEHLYHYFNATKSDLSVKFAAVQCDDEYVFSLEQEVQRLQHDIRLSHHSLDETMRELVSVRSQLMEQTAIVERERFAHQSAVNSRQEAVREQESLRERLNQLQMEFEQLRQDKQRLQTDAHIHARSDELDALRAIIKTTTGHLAKTSELLNKADSEKLSCQAHLARLKGAIRAQLERFRLFTRLDVSQKVRSVIMDPTTSMAEILTAVGVDVSGLESLLNEESDVSLLYSKPIQGLSKCFETLQAEISNLEDQVVHHAMAVYENFSDR